MQTKPKPPHARHAASHNARASAAMSFLAVYQQGSWQGKFDSAPPKGMQPGNQRALHTTLLRGVVRHARFLIHEVERLNRGKPPTPKGLALAMVGLFQLRFLNTPSRVAVNETVSAARALGQHNATGWLNGVLRSAVREGFKHTASSQPLPLPLATSYPDWMVERWQTHYDQPTAQHICQASAAFEGICLRVETRRIQPRALRQQLADEGIKTTPHPMLPNALWLERMGGLLRSQAFQQGLCYVQDSASLLCHAWLQHAVKGKVLDVCAAPGGKWSWLLGTLKQQQKHANPPTHLNWVLGCDVSTPRLGLMQQNLQRLRLGQAPLLCADGQALPFATGTQQTGFETILLDAPCSATGVIRAHPEIKWRRRPEDLPNWVNTQANLLAEAARVCRVGGNLLYITCSLEPEENQQQVEHFLAQHLNWKQQKPAPLPNQPLLDALPRAVFSSTGAFQLLPGPYWNGLYAAVLQKTAP